MRALITTFLIATSFATPAFAGPHHDQVGLRVDNDTQSAVDVYIDGSWRGTVRVRDERTFTSTPGRHDVQMIAQDTGAPLYRNALVLTPSRVLEIELEAALAQLQLHNKGRDALYVTVEHNPGFWLMPGSRQVVQVRPGIADVTTAMYTPYGLQTIGQYSWQLTGGLTIDRDIGFIAPPPPARVVATRPAAPARSRITVTNQENSTIRVYIGGAEIAAIKSGRTESFSVPPGRQMVTVVEHRGRILYNEPVTFDPRKDHVVRIANSRGTHTPRTVSTHVVGAPPSRPSHGPGNSYTYTSY